jgi:anti-sigma-K factor RskA
MKISGELAQALAAEYVLGTLRGRARARFEALASTDPAIAAAVRAWEAQLLPLAEGIPPVEPPARVWKAIEARIAPRAAPASLAAWRAFAMLAGGVASVLLAAFLWLSQGPRGEPLFVAVLSSADAVPHAVVSMHSPDILRIRMVKALAPPDNMDLELWVIPKEGAPRSLGVMPNRPGDTIIHITASDPRVRGAQSIAVTLEPRGGSPTRAPTGPLLLTGPIAPVRSA